MTIISIYVLIILIISFYKNKQRGPRLQQISSHYNTKTIGYKYFIILGSDFRFVFRKVIFRKTNSHIIRYYGKFLFKTIQSLKYIFFSFTDEVLRVPSNHDIRRNGGDIRIPCPHTTRNKQPKITRLLKGRSGSRQKTRT